MSSEVYLISSPSVEVTVLYWDLAMEFRYSEAIDLATCDLEGLCDGIPLRVNRYVDLEDIGAIRAQQDWQKYVGPLSNYRGDLGPRFSFMSVTIPECLPDRLEIVSYANEFAFMFDDIIDISAQNVIDRENKELADAFWNTLKNGPTSLADFGKTRLQGLVLLEMMALDHERAITTAKSWAKFVQNASGKEHHKGFQTLAEYLPYRALDCGQMFWHGMVTFGMGLTIPEEEMPLCHDLMEPAWQTLALQNDLFSYDKEEQDALKYDQPDVVNAVWIIMKERNVAVGQAKQLCRAKIKEVVGKYLAVVERTRGDESLSLDLRKYIEAVQYSLSGNLAWSLTCPRYHAEVGYNEIQLKRMKYGLERYPATTLLDTKQY